MTFPGTALVVPTNRPSDLRNFLKAWDIRKNSPWETLIIVEDHADTSFFEYGDVAKVHHYCHKDIETEFGDEAWIFSKKDSAIRAYGFWKAWQQNCAYIYTLDDDCYPRMSPHAFVAMHLDNVRRPDRWICSVPGTYTRGMPYGIRGKVNDVEVSMGLWTNVPDLDAIQMMSAKRYHEKAHGYNDLPGGNRLIHPQQIVPICGMNLMVSLQAVPFLYFPKMGEESPYCRFDDIWAGLVLQKLCATYGYHINVGEPWVEHRRVSDPFQNLVKEAPGIAANEKYWTYLDGIGLSKSSRRTDLVIELGEKMRKYSMADEYFRKWGEALMVWGSLFKTKE